MIALGALKETDGLVMRAADFARTMHEGQVRKYTGEPYFNHVERVAERLTQINAQIEAIAAGYLHDVMEDCGVSMDALCKDFGGPVARLVWWVTNQAPKSFGNRAERKAFECERLAGAPRGAQNIKLADIIDNTRDLKSHDPEFWKVYRGEKVAAVSAMTKGDYILRDRALMILEWSE
ncbi:HD domain-containing protein [Pseudohoeflea suaedae]|uniref:HD domain-containing protein n=1 Tax=Pseudohoeflea suaedae TaxID=877384 RepID=A0A4R5PKJ8_9HYPH|nr:HD domain-containing protein [Pseudohoeflea suaedae]TDH35744.1 HD domain-containing protein [Pseudohoeflea suaedae]